MMTATEGTNSDGGGGSNAGGFGGCYNGNLRKQGDGDIYMERYSHIGITRI